MRTKVFWFGRPPTTEDAQCVEDHGFFLETPSSERAPDFSYGRMAIFWATDTHFIEAAQSLKQFVSNALNEGLLVKIIVPESPEDARFREIKKVLSSHDPHQAKEGCYRIRTSPVDVHVLMHKCMAHDPGPQKNTSLKIYGDQELAPSDILLLQRAFHDCTEIRLQKISGGYSGARTFLVDARLKASDAGQQPAPFFAKLGSSGKLQEENSLFHLYAEHHIPWYLRPNFISSRSIFGTEYAILVGNFVQGSTSLAECARKGDGPALIGSLFEETLENLYSQSLKVEQGNLQSLEKSIAYFANHEEISKQRVISASKIFGGEEIDPQNLWWNILNLPDRPWRISSIHGDLHGENIRVRKTDAIVIDFAQARNAPVSADLANLDVWLAFDLANDQFFMKEWRETIDALYLPAAIDASLDAPQGFESRGWANDCVIAVRKRALELIEDKDEYKRVLAVYLLRQASFPANSSNPEEDEYRRTYAYWLCCQLVASMILENESTKLEAAQ